MDAIIICSMLAISVLCFIIIFYMSKWISKQNPGNAKMMEISKMIRHGAITFITQEYIAIGFFSIFMIAMLGWLLGAPSAVSYAAGTCCSALAGFIGMMVATKANVRTAEAARKSMGQALLIAFRSGAIMGLTVVSLGLAGVITLFIIYQDPNLIFSFGFGASSMALFARLGGGIYTKAADIGADLVGKIEKRIPEDDARNPAVIADNVGDNVGDVAGMGADLFESYVGSLIAAMAIGLAMFGTKGVILPIAVCGVGIVASVIGILSVTNRETNLPGNLQRGLYLSAALVMLGTYLLAQFYFHSLGVLWAVASGLIAGIFIGLLTQYYTSYGYAPTINLAKSSTTGAATNVIQGMAVGMHSTAMPVLIMCAAVYTSHLFAGVFGIAMAAVGMLSTLGMSLAINSFAPVADNAGGIVQMSKQLPAVRKRTDALDALGNTTAAMGKGFAIASAGLTALALFTTYADKARIPVISITDHNVLIGMLIGGSLPFLLSSLSIRAVANAAYAMIEEVRAQFKSGKKPDYKRCIEISTSAALKQMLAPGIIAVFTPIFIGYFLGVEALGGLLAGSLVSGVMLSIMMANSGGAWDNAKKLIEKGKHGGRGSAAHEAAIVGDTVGDPFKDTAGPSINILIKLMSIVALVCLPLFL